MAETEKKKRRRWPLILVGVAGVLAILVALAPTMVGLGLGRGTIESIVSEAVGGSTTIDTIDAGWFGVQRIDDIVVRDASGGEIARLSATIDAGLLALATGVDRYDVDLRGAVTIERRADGTFNLDDLGAKKKNEKDPNREKGEREKKPREEGEGVIPALNLSLTGLDVTLHDRITGDTTSIEDLEGSIEAASGAPVAVSLSARTKSGDEEGTLAIRSRIENALPAAGGTSLDGATLSIEVGLTKLALPFVEGSMLDDLTIVVQADDIGEAMTASISGAATLDAGASSAIEGELRLDEPLDDTGDFAFGLDRLSGTLRGTNVPTAVAQPFLPAGEDAIALDLVRDVGETVDVALTLPDGGGDLEVAVTSALVDIGAAGAVDDDGAIVVRSAHATVPVHPDLVASASDYRLSDPLGLQITLSDGDVRIAGGTFDWTTFAGVVGIDVDTPVTISRQSEDLVEHVAAIGSVDLDVTTTGATDSVEIKGTAMVDGALAVLNQTVTGLLDADGAMQLRTFGATGTVAFGRVDAAMLERFAPGYVEAMDEVLADGGLLELETATVDGDLRATVSFSAQNERIVADVSLVRSGDVVTVEPLEAAVDVSPRLIMSLVDETPVMLLEPTRVSLATQPFEIPLDAVLGDAPFALGEITATLTAATIAAQLDALENPLDLRDLVIDLALTPDDAGTVAIDGTLHRHGNERTAARLDIDAAMTLGEAPMLSSVTANLSDVLIGQIEGLVGLERGTITDWTGSGGTIRVTAAPEGDGWRSDLDLQLARLTGAAGATIVDDTLELAGSDVTLTMHKRRLTKMLAPPPREEGETPPTTLVAADDVPVTLTLETFRAPLAMFRGEAFETDAFELALEIDGGPARFTADGEPVALESLDITATSGDIGRGIDFTLQGAPSAGEDASGVIDLSGRVVRLVGDDAILSTETGQIEMNATISDAPTALVDHLLGLEGLLVDAIGAVAGGTIETKRFSRRTGWMQANLVTTNGSLDTPQLRGRKDTLKSGDEQIVATLALTDAFRKRVLEPIAPIFADIRQVEDRVKVTVTKASIPMNGDRSALFADVLIEVGDVVYDSGSTLMQALSIAKGGGREQYTGTVQPIEAKIRRGIVTYDRFEVTVGSQTLAFSGRIDLNTDDVNVRFSYPLSSLVEAIDEIPDSARDIEVPFVVRGMGESRTTSIDPEFDFAGAVAQFGIGSLVEELLGGSDAGGTGGSLFDQILREIGGDDDPPTEEADDPEKPRRNRDRDGRRRNRESGEGGGGG